MRLNVGVWLAAVALCALSALLCACGAGRDAAGPGTGSELPPASLDAPIGEPGSLLPLLPHDHPISIAERLRRRGSLVGKAKLWGNQYWQAAPEVVPDDSTQRAALAAPAGDFAWAVYRFEGLIPDDRPNLISVDLDSSALPGDYWVGLADFDRNYWRFTHVSVPAGVDNVNIDPQWKPLSEAGNLYVAVLAMGPQILNVEQVVISLGTLAPPPTELAASDGTRGDRILLSWKSTGALPDSLIVERANDPRGPWSSVATLIGAALNYSDVYDSADNAIPYDTLQYYRLRAVKGGKSGAASLSDSGYRKLAVPGSFSASAGLFADHVSLSWVSLPEAQSYELELRPFGGSEADWEPLSTISDGTQESFEHSLNEPPGQEAAPLTLYEYRIRAGFASDHSDFSAAQLGYLQIPTVQNVAATDGSFHDKVQLSWDLIDGLDGYDIYFKDSSAPDSAWALLASVAGGTNSFNHSFDSPPGMECRLEHSYDYRLKGRLGPAESLDYSAVDSGFRFLAGPQDLVASDGSVDDRISLSWTPNPQADGYRIYRLDSLEALADVGPVGSFDDLSACSVNVHEYWVSSLFEGEEGGFSNHDSGYRNRTRAMDVLKTAGGGHYCACLVIDGLPAIAYWKQPTGQLTYSRALVPQPQGPDDWVSTAVDDLDPDGANIAVCVYDGRPAIAYGTLSNADLKVALSSVPQPSLTEHWTTAIADPGGFTGVSNIALGVANAKLVMSYYDAQIHVLRYARSNRSTPVDLDFQIHQVDSRAGVGRYSSLIVQDDMPSISYYNENTGDLCYARANRTDPFALDHWVRFDIDTDSDDVGIDSSLILLNGMPAVAYVDATSGSIRLARSSVAAPSATGDFAISTVASGLGAGAECSLAALGLLAADLPAVACYDSTTQTLRLRRALNPQPAGEADWLQLDLDLASGDVGRYCSLAASGCTIGVAYRDLGNNQLRFASAW